MLSSIFLAGKKYSNPEVVYFGRFWDWTHVDNFFPLLRYFLVSLFPKPCTVENPESLVSRGLQGDM